MSEKLLIKNGLVITFIHEGYHSIKMKYADILIEDGKFLDIREEISDASAQVIDAKNLWVMPGLVDAGSSIAGAVLCSGLIPDYSRARWQGSMIHGRVLPLTDIAAETLNDAEKRAIVKWGLMRLLDSGVTTALDLSHPAFASFVAEEAEKLGLRALVYPERTANGYPAAEHSGKYLNPGLSGGEFYAGEALYSVETTSDAMYAAARKAEGLLPVRAAYCEYEKQFCRMTHGVSPLGKLDKEGLLRENTLVVGGYDTDFFDRERLRTAGSTVSISAVTAMQDCLPFPIVTNLRQDINTCLSTGYFGLSMLDEMRQAAFGGKLETNASQFQASDAFYAATIAGAQGLHMEIGRIEPGFSADLLLIDPSCFGPHNYPLIEWVYAGQSADIVGRVARGKPLSYRRCDLAACAADAQKAAQKAWNAAEALIL